jgi:hypothetical protein
MPTNSAVPRDRLDRLAMCLLLMSASCSQLPPTRSVAIPLVPAGESRIWLYRNEGPYESHQTPYFRLNGQLVGVSEPNAALYRDVPPGHYTVSVDSYGVPYPNQFANFDIRAGQETFIKVVSMRERVGGGGDSGFSLRAIFYTWLIPADAARPEVSGIPFYGNS